MPIPYDINIKVENAGTRNVTYNVPASPNRSELMAEEVAAAKEKGSIADYVKGLDRQEGHSQASRVEFADGTPIPA